MLKIILQGTFFVAIVLFYSCKEKEQTKDKYLYNKDVDICNYTGNAFVFLTRIYLSDRVTFYYDEHIHIVPIPEITDSNKFKKVDAYSTIGNRNSIRLPYSGTRYFNDLVESKDKEILPHHTCGLIEMDSIVFARVYLSYSNFKDVTNWVKSKPYSDSCDYRYIAVDPGHGNSNFPIFHIYQK